MRSRNGISIHRIANGYNVVVPSYPKPFDEMDMSTNPNTKKEEPQKGNYIPQTENVFFKATLKDVFDFLTEIEKNPQPKDDFGYAERCEAVSLG